MLQHKTQGPMFLWILELSEGSENLMKTSTPKSLFDGKSKALYALKDKKGDI